MQKYVDAGKRTIEELFLIGRDGETGNRTQNLLHLTDAVKHDAKKMSYH